MANSPHFYDVPVEDIGLSRTALDLVKRTGITSVGNCLDHFLRGRDAMITSPFGFIDVMQNEVKSKLKQHGYLPFEDIEA